jgi:hypothetical protein
MYVDTISMCIATGTETTGDNFGASSFLALLNVDHFAVDHVLIKGRIISVVYDKVGSWRGRRRARRVTRIWAYMSA